MEKRKLGTIVNSVRHSSKRGGSLLQRASCYNCPQSPLRYDLAGRYSMSSMHWMVPCNRLSTVWRIASSKGVKLSTVEGVWGRVCVCVCVWVCFVCMVHRQGPRLQALTSRCGGVCVGCGVDVFHCFLFLFLLLFFCFVYLFIYLYIFFVKLLYTEKYRPPGSLKGVLPIPYL